MNRQNRLTGMLLLAVMAVGMLFATSCKKDSKADAEALLKTVPSSVQGAGLVNLEALADKAGDVQTLLNNLGIGKDNEFVGVKPTYVAIFIDGGEPTLTGLLDDPEDFKQNYEKNTGMKFENQNGIDVCRDARVIGNQFWLVGRASDDPAKCKAYTQLSEAQSYASSEGGKRLLESDEDGAFVADINALLNISVNSSELAQARIILSTLFDGATYTYTTIDCEKGKAEIDTKVLDSKMKPAKFNLPLSKVNPEAVKMLGTSADGIGAISVSKELIDKIKSVIVSMAGNGVASELTAMLDPIDGTIAIGANNNSSSPALVISTNGSNASQLISMLNSEGISLTQQGNYLVNGTGITGVINIADAAPRFKDAFAGVILSAKAMDSKSQGISDMEIMFKPDDGSVKLDITVNATDKNQNILRTVKLK